MVMSDKSISFISSFHDLDMFKHQTELDLYKPFDSNLFELMKKELKISEMYIIPH